MAMTGIVSNSFQLTEAALVKRTKYLFESFVAIRTETIGSVAAPTNVRGLLIIERFSSLAAMAFLSKRKNFLDFNLSNFFDLM